MNVTSFQFIAFFCVLLCAYYLTPAKRRWGVLLAGSLIYYIFNAQLYTIIYLGVSVISVYWSTRLFESNSKRKKQIVCSALVLNFGILAVLKYREFLLTPLLFGAGGRHIAENLLSVRLLASLGISFYTLQITGYLLDCYWGKIKPEHNFLKVFLFTSYFPQMISGPISRFEQLSESLFTGNKFKGEQIKRGLQRVLWGFFQKLVISERMAVFVNTVYGDLSTYSGPFLWAATFGFVLQLYTDFAGCMDIVLGVSECFGIHLPENFRTPLFACTIQEFWQRWHITLGTWLKDYILYPVLKSETWYRLGNRVKKKWGKKWSRKLPTWLGLLILWLAMGIWHGNGWKYVVGEGVWFWLLIVGSALCEPLFQKLHSRWKTEGFVWKWLQRGRTFVLFAVGMVFFRADSLHQAVLIFKNCFHGFHAAYILNGLNTMALSKKECLVLFLGLAVRLIVSLYQEKGDIRGRISRLPIVIRWMLWYALIISVVIWGQYGIAYDTSNFIYAQF